MNLMKTIVFIPAYNASKVIEGVFPRIPKDVYRKINKIIIIDDGSKDRTLEVAKKISKKYKKVRIVSYKPNKGYAHAQKTGFLEALSHGADVVAMLHADGQYAPEFLGKLLKPIEDGEADVVQGSRILGKEALSGGMPIYKFIGNRVSSALENLVSGLRLAEYHSGYMLYSRKSLETIPFEKLAEMYHSHKGTCHYDGEMILLAHRNGLRIRQIPIPTRYAGEHSHVKPLKYGFEVINVILRYVANSYKFNEKPSS